MTEKKSIALPIIGAQDTSERVANRTREEGGDIMSEIAHEVEVNKVVLYMKGTPDMPQCGFSARASAILESYGTPYYAVNILADPEKRQAIDA